MGVDALFERHPRPDDDVGLIIDELARTWGLLQRTHIAVSFGCACGVSGHVRAQDFERDLLEFLWDKYADDSAALALLKKYLPGPPDDHRISDLLKGLAEDRSASGRGVKKEIAATLRRSLRSWAELRAY